VETGRFAPSTTGRAHPGTLLAALLCWLDARSRGDHLMLRLEDLDPERSRPELAREMVEDLAWLGLDWDAVESQAVNRPLHEQALDRLAGAGLLYPCRCSRTDIRRRGERAPDGGWRYGGTCRGRRLPSARDGGWRASSEPLRARLPEGPVTPVDESGLDLVQDPVAAFGDPVVRRRDGAIAYHLASVVDDARAGVTRVVRGRDLAPSTASQVALQGLLGLSPSVYRHHMLLLERQGGKLSKFHGAVGARELRRVYSAEALCGVLARAAGLVDSASPASPRDLLPDFTWERVSDRDRVIAWTGEALVLSDSSAWPGPAEP